MSRYRFNRLECAGSLGDLGTLLPLAIGMILVNGLNPMGLFFAVGLYYILSGIYYDVTVPVQPMKAIGAYAIATGMTALQIQASAILMAVFLALIAATGAISIIGRYTPKPVIRGVQLSTGVLLMSQGVKFMVGTSAFQVLRQAAEPYLRIQHLGPIPIGIIIGVTGVAVTLVLLENRRLPAGLLVVLGGIGVGVLFGTHQGLNDLRVGIHLPDFFPYGFPGTADFATALVVLVLPQIPMTLGNASIAYADLSRQYFKESSRKVTYKSSCVSMALANLFAFTVGGMPMCHGAGGLAAHYRFGARTAGSNLVIGGVFIALALFLGEGALSIAYLIPMSVLGMLLLFAGSQLALTIVDMTERKDLFVALIILGITLASNLAAGFIAGIALAYALKSNRLSV